MRPSTNISKPEKISMKSQKAFCSATKYRKQHISPPNPTRQRFPAWWLCQRPKESGDGLLKGYE
jgi:hypothetical protein